MKPASIVIPLLRGSRLPPLLARAINLDRRERDLEHKRQALRERELEMEALRQATPDPPAPGRAAPPDSADCDLVPYPVLPPGRAQARTSESPRRLRAIFKSNPEAFLQTHWKQDRDGAPTFARVLIGIAVPPMPSHAEAQKVAAKRRARPAGAGGEELYAHIVGLKVR